MYDITSTHAARISQTAFDHFTSSTLNSYRQSAAKLGEIVNEAFQYTGAQLKNSITEFQVAEFIRRRFREEGLESPDGPIVATNAHASDPHFEPAAEGSSVVRRGDWMLIDLWAKPTYPLSSPLATAGSLSSPLEKGGG